VSQPVPILLMSYDLRFGGTERQLTEAALHLDRSRFAPHVACIRLQGGRRGELERAGVPLVEFSFRSFGSWSVLSAARRMSVYLRRHRIRLVHAFDVPGNLFAVPVAWLCRIPVVLSSQRAFRELTPGIYHRLLRLTDRLADGTVVNSATLSEHLQKHDGIRAERLTLVRNGIDLKRLESGQDRAGVLPDCSVVAGSTAMLRPEKGVGTLVEAFGAIAKEFRPAGLLLVGGGPLQHRLEARAQELGIADRCHFAGSVMNVVPWLRRMDIFVLPSLSEALSNSLLEAMAVGCACVASQAGGNPELITPGQTGLLFPPGDAEGLAKALARLARDAELRRFLGANAKAYVKRNFSMEQYVASLSQLYTAQLERAGTR
jgi:glycosyltransferase involved in cell wall biosynthesis